MTIPMTTLNPERDRLVVRLYAQGTPIQEIGDAVGLTCTGVHKLLQRRAVPPRKDRAALLATRCRLAEALRMLATVDGRLPTDAPPGSVRKLAVLMARARAGLPLFHPDDSP